MVFLIGQQAESNPSGHGVLHGHPNRTQDCPSPASL